MADRYWVGGSGNTSGTTHWSATSGGANGASNPTSSDDVYIDSNSGLSGGTITLNVTLNCNNFISSPGYPYSINTTGTNQTIEFYGSFTMESGVTASSMIALGLNATTGNKTIDTNGVVFGSLEAYNQSGSVATWTLQSDLTLSGTFDFEYGTFIADDYNVTAGNFYFYANIGYTPTIVMGSGTWTPGRSSWVLDENNGQVVTIIPPPQWTDVRKPTTQAYTNLNPMGKEQYNQADVEYDSATTFYDGVNPSQWTDISKPITNNWQSVSKPT